jgi:acetolactate synthase-1/2/3 large subunit
MKLADALVTTLRDWDLRYIFGVGGANIEHVYDSIHRLGQGRIQSVCAKSEIGAAWMADCRARVHRTLGVCCSTSGGGMMNLAVGVAESFAESVPLLALVGQPPTNLAGRGAFQDSSGIGRSVNADQLWSAISKFQARLEEPGQFWTSLELAASTALSGRPGPSVLLIPRDLYDCEVGQRPVWFPHQFEELVNRTDPPSNAVSELFDAIRGAHAPVLLLGSGVDHCSDPHAIIHFARRAGIQVATTIAGKNSFPNDDPLYLGMVGVAGEPAAHQFLLEQADLIVAVGTDLNMMTCQPIQHALQPERLAVVNVDLADVLRMITPALCVEGDPGAVFLKLNRICDQCGAVSRLPASVQVTRFVPQLAPVVPRSEFRLLENELHGSLLQSDALNVLQRFLPRRGHVLFDAGNCAAAALHYLRIPANVSTTVALGMGGMGYAIAAGIGAQMGSPRGTRSIVLCGDGAFVMLGAEVNTAVHYQLPILFVVFNNGMHGMCVTRQQLFFEGRVEGSRYPAISVAEMARGLGSPSGLWVGSAETTDQLEEQLADFGSLGDRPGVLELRLGQEQIPPFTPFLAADAPVYQADLAGV